ncbi:MAG: hypothetical protein PHN75_05685 [Syntrophales bacterium]|nr:hypothetical protein [Syntrophales bacterium]
MKIRSNAILLTGAGLMLAVIMAMTGCVGTRTVMINPAQAESKNMVQLPISVRVELKGLKQEDPNPVTPVLVDRESLKEMLRAYLKTKDIFQSVLDGPSDSVLNVDVRYRLNAVSVFEYVVNLKAYLISKDGLDLGRYSGQGIVKGGGKQIFSRCRQRAPE